MHHVDKGFLPSNKNHQDLLHHHKAEFDHEPSWLDLNMECIYGISIWDLELLLHNHWEVC